MAGLTTYPRTDGSNRTEREIYELKIQIEEYLGQQSICAADIGDLLALLNKIGWQNLPPDLRAKLYRLLYQRAFGQVFNKGDYLAGEWEAGKSARRNLARGMFGMAAQVQLSDDATRTEFNNLAKQIDTETLCDLLDDSDQQSERVGIEEVFHNCIASPHSGGLENRFAGHRVGAIDVLTRMTRYQMIEVLAERASGIPGMQESVESLRLNIQNEVRSEAAQYVYEVDQYQRAKLLGDDSGPLKEAPVGLDLLDEKAVPEIEGLLFTDLESGLGAALFRSKITGELMLTFRGTRMKPTSLQDWRANIEQGCGDDNKQYEAAMALAEQVCDALEVNENLNSSSLRYVGHSLGGGLSIAASGRTKNPAYVFNPAALTEETLQRTGCTEDEINELVLTQYVYGEALTVGQKYASSAISFLTLMFSTMALYQGYMQPEIFRLMGDYRPPRISGRMSPLYALKWYMPIKKHGMDVVCEAISAEARSCLQDVTSELRGQLGSVRQGEL